MDKWNGSNTTLAKGLPLCRFHHMELHANDWRIIERDGELVVRSTEGLEVPLRPRSPFLATA